MNDKLKAKLDRMPDSPGCYIYKDWTRGSF